MYPTWGDVPVTTSPSTSTRPPVGFTSPAMTDKSVLLPQPDGPTMLRNSPFSTPKLTDSKALISPFSA